MWYNYYNGTLRRVREDVYDNKEHTKHVFAQPNTSINQQDKSTSKTPTKHTPLKTQTTQAITTSNTTSKHIQLIYQKAYSI